MKKSDVLNKLDSIWMTLGEAQDKAFTLKSASYNGVEFESLQQPLRQAVKELVMLRAELEKT